MMCGGSTPGYLKLPSSKGQVCSQLSGFTCFGFSPFMVSLGYPPQSDYQEEKEVVVPSVPANLRHCRNVWRQVHSALLRSSLQTCRHANHHRAPAPVYQPGQKVWLSTKYLLLQVASKKLTPRYVSPFEVERMIDTTAVCLKLPAALKIHSMFHVSRVKPVRELELSPPIDPPTPLRIIDGVPAYMARHILDMRGQG